MADWSQFNPWGAPDFPSNAAFGTGAPAEDAERQPNILDKLLASFASSAATLPQRAIGAADTYSKTGEYNPAPIVEAAMLPMGTGAVAGVPVKAGEAVLGAGPIRAYHGSPHDFDKFDLSKIGTGEGAQAYGRGLYFAEHEPTARWYRDTLGPMVNPPPAADQVATDALQRFGGREQAVSALDNVIKTREAGMYKPTGQFFPHHDEASLARDLLKSDWQPKPPGKMYEVNINADPAHFLDWDKPLSQQSDIFGRLKESGIINNKSPPYQISGQATPQALVRMPVDAGSVESRISDLGIPGIKYLDQGSRGNVVPASSQHIYKPWGGPLDVPKPSSNYVVFNDKLISILRKYGLAGLAPPLFANATANEPKS